MTVTGPQIISELRGKLQFAVGRHLYGVLGTYSRLDHFQQQDLAQGRDHEGRPFPEALNLNRELLARIADADLKQLVRDEASYPRTVQWHLNKELGGLLRDHLRAGGLVILKQLELLFAYDLDLSVFRVQASDRNHVLLLLPGARRGERITLFYEADPRFHRTVPANLIADNHLWELTDD